MMEAIYAAQTKFASNLGLQKVKVIHNPNYVRHGTKSYVSLLNRYGFEPTLPGPYRHVHRAHQRGLVGRLKHKVGGRAHMERTLVKQTGEGDATQSGEVTAQDQQNDSMYICEVQIGTPPQKLLLDFDTGSADLWVFSTELNKSLQQNHNVFNPSKSSTWKELSGKAWQIQYGDGSTASGDVGDDKVTIGGLTINNQAVECAKQLSDQFSQGTSDGLLGLAWGSINTVTSNGQSDPQPTPVMNMITQSDIPKESELFTSAFYSERDQSPESFYTFGYIDQDLVSKSGQDINWVDIDNSQGFWQFSAPSYSVNGQSIAVSGNTAIADTGTTLALVSDNVCSALYKQIPGAKYDQNQQGYVFPTSTQASDLPTFKVTIGNTEFEIQKEDLAFAATGDGNWYGGVQSRGTMDFDILGDTFLKSIYAIWDQGNKRFGAVPKIEATQNLTPPATSSGTGEKVPSTRMIASV